ncbi:MAG TPA: response regulator [Microlunatus sp.]|nr:response regulator [Microlunatus sp.]
MSRGSRGTVAVSHAPLPRAVLILGGAWAVLIAVVTATLAVGVPQSEPSQLLGNLGIFVALGFCAVTSAIAATRKTRARLGWGLMALGMFLGLLGQLGWVLAAMSGAEASTSTLADTLAFLGYALPTMAAIFAFPRRSELLISRFRQLLDVLVITIGVVLISEATVLGVVRQSADTSTLEGWLALAYPVADIAVCALVLCFGMRQQPGDRVTWLFLGSGLLFVAITDSIYVRLMAEGQSALTGSALVAGWMLGPVLIGLATFVPMTGKVSRGGRDYTLALQLVPYLPVIGSMIVLSIVAVLTDPFLVVMAILLLVTVTIRQVMIVYENVSLTRDLEAKVASRTAQLTTLGSIVTSSSDAIVGISMDDKITAWNPAAERLYGHPAAEVIGKEPDFLMPEGADRVRGLLDAARKGEPLPTYETVWERPDGSTVPVAVTVSPVLDDDGVQGISFSGQDITERRRAAEVLERAREEALESSRLKSEFLATMSHEIRTPMNGVIGLTTLLLETELDETQRQYAEGVQSAGDALLSVINDILDFSKLEAGKVVLDVSDFSPRKVVEEVGALLAPAAAAKRLELIAYCLPEVPDAVHGDVGRIRQILLNLAANAVKFTPSGEVIIRARAQSHDDQVKLLFEVVDTGIGIAERDQARLFESFSQADASTTRRFGGTGLGLAISRRLVEVMGGQIGLESELGAGSTFWFEVTLRVASSIEPPINELSHELLKNLRVLVVDDNETNRTILKAQLEAWKMRPELADRAAVAFEMLRSSALKGHPFDLAALDMQMPEVDGLELARRICSDPLLEGMPMIMLTSSLQLDPAIMRSAGVRQWLSKPVRSSELFDRLMRLMVLRGAELQARRHPRSLPAAPGASRGRLLIVEDNALNRLVAERIAARLGFEAECVVDGEAAVTAVARQHYAAVLMDCHMPNMDGFQATRAIRRLEAGARHTPIIAMTAGALVEDRERCLAAGMDDYVTKPIDSDVLDTTLSELVGRPTVEPFLTGPESPSASRPVAADHADTASGPPMQPPADAAPVQGSAHRAAMHGIGSADPRTPFPEVDQLVDDHDTAGSVIDHSRLMDLAELPAADGSSLLSSMITSYVGRGRDRLRRIEDALATGDDETLASASHELKGSSGTIGANRVMTLAAELERNARNHAPSRPGLINELRTALDAAVAELHEIDVPAVSSP